MTYDKALFESLSKMSELAMGVIQRNRRTSVYRLFASVIVLIAFGMVPLISANLYLTFFSLGASVAMAFYMLANIILECADYRTYKEEKKCMVK